MSRFLARFFALAAYALSLPAAAQTSYTLTVEPVITHTTPYVSPFGTVNLNGMTTYRIYVNTVNQSDLVSAITGFNTNPLIISSTSVPAWYNDTAFGVNLGSEMNAGLFGFLPHLQYDSWLTIGAAESTPGYTLSETTPAPHWAAFNVGQNININSALGWSLFGLNPCPSGVGCNYTHPAYGGSDYKVLLGQITTAGVLSGVLNLQLFVGGLGANEQLLTFAFEGPGTFGVVVPGCTDETACNFDAAATSDDGSCTFPDVGYTCAGTCISDVDSDGVCDALEVPGCSNSGACNFSPTATDDDGTCIVPSDCDYCDGGALVLGTDYDGDGVCSWEEVVGCTIPIACNFNPAATDDNGSCYFYCPGCTVPSACNFDPNARQNNGSCLFPVNLYGVTHVDCAGACLNDNDGDGVCNEDEVPGCMDPSACNFNPEATDSLIPCTYAPPLRDCTGQCLLDGDGDGLCDAEDACPADAANDADGDGVCADAEVFGCTVSTACNYSTTATEENGTCTYPVDVCGSHVVDCTCTCLNDTDGDEVCNENEVFGCMISAACNFLPEATDAGLCEFTSCAGCIYAFACNYDPEATIYNGSCVFGTCPGCTHPAACNFNPTVSTDDGSCVFPDACGECNSPYPPYTDCAGNCLNDGDSDGICDEVEVPGCTAAAACNYLPEATDDDGSCSFAAGCDFCSDGAVADGDADDDGVCDGDEIAGCTAAAACNYLPEATDNDGSCSFAAGCEFCQGGSVADGDADDDGVCDGAEVVGCMEPEACNYHAAATDPGTCLFATGCDVCTGEVDGSGSVVDFDVNNNGVCDPLELPGCTYPEACNFDAAAGWDDGSCSFPSAGFDCAGACTLDTNGNGVCDLEEWEACETAAPSGDICGPGTFWDEAAGACMLLQCPGDFNGDQWIGTADLLELLARFEAPCGW